MNEFAELLEKFWFVRESDSGDYFRMKRAADNKMKRFLNESVGWNIIINHKVVKIEKIPAQAQPFMGIQEFETPKDYCLLCALLIYLDDLFDGEQFLLTELTDNIPTILGNTITIDFTKFSDRKSMVRVLKFAQKMSLISITDGSIDNAEHDLSKQILYENTGLSAYFTVNHAVDISQFQTYRDFEDKTELYLNNDVGYARTSRVYRKLLLQPAMYWESKEDTDSLYLKNQRRHIARNLEDYIDGRLDIHNGSAFCMLHETDSCGNVHPSGSALSGFVALVCAALRNADFLPAQPNDTHKTFVKTAVFHNFLLQCREQYGAGLGKQLRELSEPQFLTLTVDYFVGWLLLERTEQGYLLCEGIYKTVGYFPKDYQPTISKEE